MTRSIEHIRWADSWGCTSSWDELPDECPPLPFCESVGWVARENDEVIVLAPNWCENDGTDVCGRMVIPKRSVLERTVLKTL